jgi:hypothetical protein
VVQELVAFSIILAQNGVHAHACTQMQAERVTKCSSTLLKTVFLRLSTVADHLHKILHTQKCMQVNRRNIRPVVEVTISALI